MGINSIKKSLDFMFGQTNAQQLKRYEHQLREINDLEEEIKKLSDAELAAKTVAFRKLLQESETREEIRNEAGCSYFLGA